MAHGFKTGGRAAGVPNKRTQAVADMLTELNCCPIIGMAKLAMDEATPVAVRAAMFRELAQYVYPKRRSIELSASDEFPQQITIQWIGAAPEN